MRRRALGLLLVIVAGCSRTTSELLPETRQRFEAEGIVRQADDVWIRYTHGIGTYRSGWEDLRASVIVTRQTILIHRNHDGLIEIIARSTGSYRVNRDHDRLILRAGSGGSRRSWSFQAPEDPEGWAHDTRAAIRRAK